MYFLQPYWCDYNKFKVIGVLGGTVVRLDWFIMQQKLIQPTQKPAALLNTNHKPSKNEDDSMTNNIYY